MGAAVQGPELMAVAALNRLPGHVLRHQPAACHSYDAPPGSAAATGHRPARRRRRLRRVGRRHRDHERRQGSGVPVDQGGDAGRRHRGHRVPHLLRAARGARSLGLRALEISSHPRHGINLDELGAASTSQPVAAVALVSNFSNPTGSCMTDAAKRGWSRSSDRHDVPLVEDDVYGELAFEGPRPTAIKAFDQPRPRAVLLVVQQDGVAGTARRVGHPGPLPERGRAAEARRQPGHRGRPPAGAGRLSRQRRLRPPHPTGPPDVPGPDGGHDRRRRALLPRFDPARRDRRAGTSCGCSCPTVSTPWSSTTRPSRCGITDRAGADVLAVGGLPELHPAQHGIPVEREDRATDRDARSAGGRPVGVTTGEADQVAIRRGVGSSWGGSCDRRNRSWWSPPPSSSRPPLPWWP